MSLTCLDFLGCSNLTSAPDIPPMSLTCPYTFHCSNLIRTCHPILMSQHALLSKVVPILQAPITHPMSLMLRLSIVLANLTSPPTCQMPLMSLTCLTFMVVPILLQHLSSHPMSLTCHFLLFQSYFKHLISQPMSLTCSLSVVVPILLQHLYPSQCHYMSHTFLGC